MFNGMGICTEHSTLQDFHHSPPSASDVMKELSSQELGTLDSRFFDDEHRKRELDFERSQNERKLLFEDGIQRRQHIFLANEKIREDTFELDQRNREVTYEEKAREREASFLRSQQEKERGFLTSEARRELSFCEEEAVRVSAELEAQRKRGELFDTLQDNLRKQCFEDEVRRISDLESWALALLRERKQQQVDGYKDEERIREERFVRSVDLRSNGR